MSELCRKNRRSPSPLPPPLQSAHQVSIQHQTSPTFLSWIEMFEIKRSSYSFRRWNLQLCLCCQRKAGKGAFPDHKVKEHLLVCIQTSWGYSADLSGERETKEREMLQTRVPHQCRRKGACLLFALLPLLIILYWYMAPSPLVASYHCASGRWK